MRAHRRLRPLPRRTPACTSRPWVSAPRPGPRVDVDGYRIHTALDAGHADRHRQDQRRLVPPGLGRRRSSTASPRRIDLRLTVHDEDVPLAGAFTAFALLLLARGAVLTVLRTGRLV